MANKDSEQEQHRKEMRELKSEIRQRVAEAAQDKGVIVVLTGNGKGKSSSGFGMALRCLGHGMGVGVVQFIKGKWKTGEQQFFSRHPDVRYFSMGDGFTWDTQDKTADIARAEACWQEAKKMLADPAIDFLLLDELNVVLSYGYLSLEAVIPELKNKPASMHIVITGRDAPQELLDIADTISVVESPKHAFADGIRAQKGVEF